MTSDSVDSLEDPASWGDEEFVSYCTHFDSDKYQFSKISRGDSEVLEYLSNTELFTPTTASVRLILYKETLTTASVRCFTYKTPSPHCVRSLGERQGEG